MSVLISSVTFKLSGSRRGGWSREASPRLLGKNFLRQEPGTGKAAGRGTAPRRGTRTWEGGAESAEAHGAALVGKPGGLPWEEVISATCEPHAVRGLGVTNGKRKPGFSRVCQVKSEFVGIGKRNVYLAGLVSVDETLKPPTRSLFLSGKSSSLTACSLKA